ncbi:hypothetical protein PMAYCL1PPCAC_04125, partial [Pristionchus mayeri]
PPERYDATVDGDVGEERLPHLRTSSGEGCQGDSRQESGDLCQHPGGRIEEGRGVRGGRRGGENIRFESER